MSTIYSNNETVNINPADDLVLYKEEFINSRIEKFLYAICALDFNDLPNPLSRIEELYKCLATGLPAPTFVPQSRVEKYLMAILGGYDANALPAPQSRTEVLLNKILLGDTDLSDIEWLKSRYEFLLAYIAKSGETSSGPDMYYANYSLDDALTTLYNTVEYPVKSAILKGNTLVNSFMCKQLNDLHKRGNVTISNGVFTLTAKNSWDTMMYPKTQALNVKPSTTYTLMLYVEENSLDNTGTELIEIGEITSQGSSMFTTRHRPTSLSIGVNKFLLTTKNDFSSSTFGFVFRLYSSVVSGTLKFKVSLVEGDYTNVDIPYFEGIQSSILYPDQKVSKITWKSGQYYNDNGELTTDNASVHHRYFDEYVEIHPNHLYTITGNNNYKNLNFYDENKNHLLKVTGKSLLGGDGKVTSDIYATAPANAKYMRYNMSAGSNMDEDTTIFDTTLGIPLMKTSITETYFYKMYVTTTGKNLFDDDTIFKQGYINYMTGNFNVSSTATDMITDYIPFSSKGEFVVSYDGDNRVDIVCYDIDKNYINGVAGNGSVINITENTAYIIVMVRNVADTKNRVQIERGTVPTPFEPHKSTTVSCNEEVELRGIGDIKDELNLVTGELTQRIQERVFDGSSDELWSITTNGSGLKRFVSTVTETHSNYLEITNWLPTANKSYWSLDENGFYIGTNGRPVIVFNTNDSRYNMSITEFENYLSQNPLIVQYPLIESVKTVDLSTLDQYGKETELSTFDDITHVIVSLGGLVPTGDIVTSRPIYFANYSLDNSYTTLHDTVEYPVKNAVLRGQTLVNLVGTYKHTVSTVNKPIVWGQKRLFLTNIKPNTIYTLKAKMTEVVEGNYGPRVQIFFSTYSTGEVNTTTSTSDTLIFTSPAELSSDAHLRLIVTGSEAEATEVDFEILLLEGEFPVGCNIPYFDHIASVKMPVLTTTGKNLFDAEQTPTQEPGIGDNVKKVILNENTSYAYSSSPYTGPVTFRFFDCYDAEIARQGNIRDKSSFVTPVGTLYAKVHTDKDSNVQIEEGLVATQYEPHKSNILTCNEEVELRRIGDVKDELNLVTGELTERIGEVVLDGDESWSSYGNYSNQVNTVAFKLSHTNHVSSWGTGLGYCDKMIFTNGNVIYGQDSEGVTTDANNIIVRISNSKVTSVDEFKAWLSNNNLRVVYQLKEEIIKTVDLSTLDQDGKETELSTFDDITHVIVSSEVLVPTGDIDIARPIQFVDYSLDNGWTTLYNTFEHPVKSAILKGMTLVNLAVDGLTEKILSPNRYADFVSNLYKQSTTYTIVLNVVTLSDTGTIAFHEYDEGTSLTTKIDKINVGINKILFTSSNNVFNRIRLRNPSAATTNLTIKNVMILEGDYTNVDIPYFTGMQSVKMPVLTTTGKNLSDRVVDILIPSNTNIGEYKNGQLANIPIPKGQFYVSFKSNRTQMPLYIHDKETRYYHYNRVVNNATTDLGNHVRVGYCHNNVNMIIDNSNGYPYMTLLLSSGISTVEHYIKDFMISSTSDGVYEPYKSNILTCNEEVELRRIGDIKDELDLVTGELVQKIGTYTFTGDENWRVQGGEIGGYTYFACDLGELIVNYDYNYNIPLTCNRLPLITYNDFDSGLKNVGINLTYCFRLNFSDCDSNNGATVEDLKAYLKANPTTVQYPTSRSVKTVDLSILDQYGKETELSTFDDITHVIVSSEGLVPTGEITVATKNATDVIDAGVMSLRMDDILNSQSTLEGSANVQSDDIDVAMLGTTDIYEQLL